MFYLDNVGQCHEVPIIATVPFNGKYEYIFVLVS